jgi:hypothetical protein
VARGRQPGNSETAGTPGTPPGTPAGKLPPGGWLALLSRRDRVAWGNASQNAGESHREDAAGGSWPDHNGERQPESWPPWGWLALLSRRDRVARGTPARTPETAREPANASRETLRRAVIRRAVFWFPLGVLVGSLWFPLGVLVGSLWFPLGVLVGSLWFPLGVLVGSL